MDRLKSPLSKLSWARDKLTTVNVEIAKALADHPHQIIREHDAESGLKMLRLPLAGKPPLPEPVSHLIGEYATALRASLDHLVWALHVSAPKRPNKVQFPIFDNHGQFTKESILQLDGVVAAAKIDIERLQPYHATESHRHPLWRLHRLSNTDKHRIIVVVPYSFMMSYAIPGASNSRMGLIAALRENLDEDPKLPIPPELEMVGAYFDFKVEPTFAIVLQNADIDTGLFMEIRELPTLYEHVRDKVFPPLKALIP